MPDIGWGIIIESPYSVRQTFVKRARDQSLMLIVACILLIFLLALFYILSINRNFRQLIKAIKAMAEGNYARRIRLITNSITPMEIVLLTGEFNRMARRMAEAWRNSQELNQELVKRNEQEAFLSGITKRLHGRLSLEEIGQLTVTDLGQYLPSGVCALVLEPYQDPEAMGPSAQSFPKQGWLWENGQFPELQTEQLLGFELGPFESTAPLLQGQPLVIQADAHPWLRVFQLGPVTLQPVVYQAQRLGYVLLAGPKTEEAFEPSLFQPVFGEEAMHMVQLVANQVGVAVHQAYQWQMIQEANKKLAKLDEFKSNLIDTVSHELRTPLTSIKGYTSRLLRYDHTLSGETRTKSLKVIKQQADRLGRLVEDLLVIPDLETANLRVFPDQVFLPELVERSVQFIQEKAQRDIQVHLPPDVVPPVMADPDRMEQILLNLLDNAVKYSLPDTTITVQLFNPEAAPLGMIRQHPRQVTLCVANQSETIPREAINSLFDKFKRLDDSTTRTTRGSGLGLFITKGLVEAMGGQIALDYRNGQFVVSVTLPLYSESTQMDQPLPVPVE
jgi:signal transduction histidine kinase